MIPSTAIRDFTDLKLPTEIKAVLIDFDNTFYQYQPCHTHALAEVRRFIETRYGALEDFEKLYKEAQEKVKRRIPNHAASHSRILYFQNFLEELNSEHLISESLELETIYWQAFKSKMVPIPGLLDFLAECKKSGTKVVVVSDLTTRLQFQKLIQLGVADLISQVVTSEEAGAEKPDPAIFRLALEKLELVAADVIMIGDSEDRDIKGAEALGIPTIQIVHETITP